jgi:hypothetical protein
MKALLTLLLHLLSMVLLFETTTTIAAASFIETAARSYTTGVASSSSLSLYQRYAAVNDLESAEPDIILDMMNTKNVGGQGRRILLEDNNEIIEIDTYFHVYVMNETDGDDVDEETIQKQLTVLNEAYGGLENSLYMDCDGNPTVSYETGFRFNMAGETTRTTLMDLEDESFLATVTQEEMINIYFLLEQGSVFEDLASPTFENFLNLTLEEQIESLAYLPNAGLTYLPFFLGKKIRQDNDDTVDDCTKLHIYIQPGQSMPAFGYAQQPWTCRQGDQMNELRMMDGVFLHRATLPDSNFKLPNKNAAVGIGPAEEELSWVNQGDTAVHEVGHWLGLTHTFAGATMSNTTGCDIFGGDEILDTPAQADMGPLYCTERPCCNLEQDTCPHIPGTDPVWNFMDYSDDCCMSRFSPMQVEKMKYSYKLFREDYYTNNNITSNSNSINDNTSNFADKAIEYVASANTNSTIVEGSAGVGNYFGFTMSLFLSVFVVSCIAIIS